MYPRPWMAEAAFYRAEIHQPFLSLAWTTSQVGQGFVNYYLDVPYEITDATPKDLYFASRMYHGVRSQHNQSLAYSDSVAFLLAPGMRHASQQAYKKVYRK